MVSRSADLILLSLSAYALTFIIASSAILEPFRRWLIPRSPWLQATGQRHFIECRMCVGFWVTLAVCTDWSMILPVYGLSYFLATQER